MTHAQEVANEQLRNSKLSEELNVRRACRVRRRRSVADAVGDDEHLF